MRAAFRPGASGPSRPTLATLSRLVRAKADTARLMRGKTTFLYWGVPNIRRVEAPKENLHTLVVSYAGLKDETLDAALEKLEKLTADN